MLCTLARWTQVAFYDGADSRYPIGQWHVPFNTTRDLEQNAMTFPGHTGGKETMVGGQYACEQINPAHPEKEGLNGQNVDNATGAKRHTLRDFQTVLPNARGHVKLVTCCIGISAHIPRRARARAVRGPRCTAGPASAG